MKIISKILFIFRAKRVYITGLLIYSIGMFFMAVTKHKIGVILFSWTAGVMYSTLFTMPFLLVAHYHAKGVVSIIFQIYAIIFHIRFGLYLMEFQWRSLLTSRLHAPIREVFHHPILLIALGIFHIVLLYKSLAIKKE